MTITKKMGRPANLNMIREVKKQKRLAKDITWGQIQLIILAKFKKLYTRRTIQRWNEYPVAKMEAVDN